MKKILVLLSLVFSINTFANCEKYIAKENLCVEIKWIDGPVLNKLSSFVVNFFELGDESKTPVSPEGEIEIYSWMMMANGHNHGGPRMTWTESEEGTFLVEDARFFMGHMKGYWQVRVDVEDETVAFRVKF